MYNPCSFLVGMTALPSLWSVKESWRNHSIKTAASCLFNWNHLFRMIWGKVDAYATIYIPGYGIC